MSRRTFQTNLTSGELDPQFLGRMSLSQYQNGVEKMRNFLPLPQGGATRRPGLEFIENLTALGTVPDSSKDRPRLVRFEFSIGQVYDFVFSDKRIDIFRDDVPVFFLTIGVPWSISELSELTWIQNLDTILFFHKDHPTTRVMRQGSDSDWDIAPWDYFNIPQHEFSDSVAGGVDAVIELNIANWGSGERITLFLNGVESDVITGGATEGASALAIEEALSSMVNTVTFEPELVTNGAFATGIEGWTLGVNWVWNGLGYGQHGAGTSALSQTLSTILNDKYLLGYNYFILDSIGSFTPSLGGTAGITQTVVGSWRIIREIIQAGATDGDISFSAVEGMLIDNITVRKVGGIEVASLGGGKYKVEFTESAGRLPWIITAGNLAFDDASITALILPTTVGRRNHEDAWSEQRGYPRCGTFFQGSLWVAGSREAPQTVWKSRVNDFNDFDNTNTGDTWGFAETLDTKEVSAIFQLHPGRHLQLFTSSKEFYIPISKETLVTPSNVFFRENSERGIKSGIPIVSIDGATIFVQRDGKSVRSFVFQDIEDAYLTESISLFSSHLIRDPVDIAFRRAVSTSETDFLYVVNSDGTLAVLAFMRAQEVIAWALLSTEGEFLSVEVHDTSGGREVRFLIRRLVDGEPVIYLEKFNKDLQVDAGIIATGLEGGSYPTTSSISWLDNVLVEVIVDGVIEAQQQLPSVGPIAVVFENPAEESWQVGFPFPDVKGDGAQAWIKTLPWVSETREGISVGEKVRVFEVLLRLFETRTMAVQGNELSFRAFGDDLLDQPIASFTGDKILKGLRGWSTLGQVDIVLSHSLSATLLGIGTKVQI